MRNSTPFRLAPGGFLAPGESVPRQPTGHRPVGSQCREDWGNLRRLRDGWDEVEAEETRLLRRMTVQESLRHLAALQRAFEPQLQQTEPLFRAERLAYLEELQRRLARLGEWMERQSGLPG